MPTTEAFPQASDTGRLRAYTADLHNKAYSLKVKLNQERDKAAKKVKEAEEEEKRLGEEATKVLADLLRKYEEEEATAEADTGYHTDMDVDRI